MSLPRYLSAFDVKERLGVSYSAALRIMRWAGAVKVGALVRVSELALESYLERCQDKNAALECTDALGAPFGTPRSTTPTSTSVLARTTRRKPRLPSQPCLSAAEFKSWRPAKSR